MANCIKRVNLWCLRLDPLEAEVYISVYPEALTSSTQVRARLVGPTCPYAATVEVAYPLREHRREYESTGIPGVHARAVVPEPNLWTPAAPFLYRAVIELWQRGERCDRRSLSHGFRQIHLVPKGLRLNASLLCVKGAVRSDLPEAEALALHAAGTNTILAPVSENTAALWETADRIGFLMLGRISDKAGLSLALELRRHPSCLGWLLDPVLWEDPVKAAVLPDFLKGDGLLVGLDVSRWPPGPPIDGFDFLAGSAQIVPSLRLAGLPILVTGKKPEESLATQMVEGSGVLGFVEG
jgi:hypothetical protein